MAKELPYFKFNSTEWMTGEIVFEPLEVQGLFINICALYWKNLGVLEISQIEQRYKKKKLIDQLSGRFFSVSSGFISIDFLDEQLHERDALSEKNKINGGKGGRPKKTQNNPPLLKDNPTITQPKPKKSNIEEEREEEDIRGFGFPEFINLINSITGKRFQETPKVKVRFNSRIKDGATREMFDKAIRSAFADKFMKEGDFVNPKYITDADNLDKWFNSNKSNNNDFIHNGQL